MADPKVSNRAYTKILFHALKYPHRAVNGILLADKKKLKENKALQLADCVPMFHLSIGLAPMLEVALVQIDSYCQANGLIIAGYYHGNEHLKDSTPSSIALKIADKIHENCNEACLFMIDNTKISLECNQSVLKLYTQQDNKWKAKSSQSSFLDDEESCLATARDLINTKAQQNLVDFDNHLDDITLDWLNRDLNKEMEDLL